MKKLTTVFVITTLLLNAMAPTLAYSATYLQGAEVNANTLVQDAYVVVTYRDSNGEEKLEKGWIDAVGETSFAIRAGGLKSKKTIAYDEVLSVTMSEESTVPAKQMNEVNRLLRDIKKREIEQTKKEEEAKAEQVARQRLKMIEREIREAEQAAKQRLKDKIVTNGQFDLSKIDSIVVKPGTYVEVTYGTGERDPVSRAWERLDTARGYIQAIYPDRLVIGERFWKKEIALNRVQKLTMSIPQKKSSFEIGTELLSVQFFTDEDPFTTIIRLDGLSGRLSPSIYVSSFFLNRLAFDLGLGVTAVSSSENTWAVWVGQGGVTYLPQGTASNSVYIRSFGVIFSASTSYSYGSNSRYLFGAGIGVGHRHIVQDRMAIRLEALYMRWFEEKQDLIRLRLSFGVVLGGKSSSPKSE